MSVLQAWAKDGAPRYYNVETVLPDYKLFQKWNNNVGYVDEKIFSSTLDAFSHWTYDSTGGFLNVVDLQGVDRKDKYILTDPVINCLEPRFGRTNLGQIGMKQFFKTHVCGDVCSKMGLRRNNYFPSRFSSKRPTKRVSKNTFV